MSPIHAILLIPAEGDPLGLLAGGPCGARPPVASRSQSDPHRWFAGRSHRPVCALVLAWEGKPVAQGCFALAWAARDNTQAMWASAAAALRGVSPARIGRHGTLVLLDADGKEVQRGE